VLGKRLYEDVCSESGDYCDDDDLLKYDNVSVTNKIYAKRLEALYYGYKQSSATSGGECLTLKTLAAETAVYSYEALWTQGGALHILSNIQTNLGASITKPQYLDSFLESTAGVIKELDKNLKYQLPVDVFNVASSKHLSRLLQAASVLFLDDEMYDDSSISSMADGLLADMMCLSEPAETLRKRIRNKPVPRTLALTRAVYLGKLEACWIKGNFLDLALDETIKEEPLQYEDVIEGVMQLVSGVIGYYYSVTNPAAEYHDALGKDCEFGGNIEATCADEPLLPKAADEVVKCSDKLFSIGACPAKHTSKSKEEKTSKMPKAMKKSPKSDKVKRDELFG
jgi:hypothetical protein